MKLIVIVLSFFGYNTPKDSRSSDTFTKNEIEFINNVIKINGVPTEIYRDKKYIRVNYPYQRLQLARNGFIHEIEVLLNGEWINVGTEEDAY
jgi:surfactin synthase thioesterase subunit